MQVDSTATYWAAASATASAIAALAALWAVLQVRHSRRYERTPRPSVKVTRNVSTSILGATVTNAGGEPAFAAMYLVLGVGSYFAWNAIGRGTLGPRASAEIDTNIPMAYSETAWAVVTWTDDAGFAYSRTHKGEKRSYYRRVFGRKRPPKSGHYPEATEIASELLAIDLTKMTRGTANVTLL